MHGAGMGTLRMYVLVGSQATLLGSYSGDHGNTWYSTKATIRSVQPYQVNFAGIFLNTISGIEIMVKSKFRSSTSSVMVIVGALSFKFEPAQLLYLLPPTALVFFILLFCQKESNIKGTLHCLQFLG